MAATDRVITLAHCLKWEVPGGDVLLSDGGVVIFGSETYQSEHAAFGAIFSLPSVATAFGDMAQGGKLVLAPNAGAALADWWRMDLFGTRMRLWQVEVEGAAVTASELLLDWLVDTPERVQGPDGMDLLQLSLISNLERAFLVNEGNVCSDRHHQSLFPGELGFVNCTDVTGFVAWGTANPQRSAGGYSAPGSMFVIGAGGRTR